jgi:hypothetical protein
LTNCTRPTVEPAPILLKLQQVVQRWLAGSDDSEIASNAADNFYLDHDAAHRRADLNRALAEIGPIVASGDLEVYNALRGRWRVEGERGALQILLTLTPTIPPRIQALTLTRISNA